MHQTLLGELQWQPWIGKNYSKSNRKLLIVGESHYDSPNREGELEEPECIQWFIDGVGLNDPHNPQPLIRNIERAFYGDKPSNYQKFSITFRIILSNPRLPLQLA